MKLFHQTKFGGPDATPEEQGDCYATALTIMLGGSPRDRDQLHALITGTAGDQPGYWFNVAIGWTLLRTNGIYTIDTVGDLADLPENTEEPRKKPEPPLNRYVMASGQSPRGDYLHSVLFYRDGGGEKPAWDPHPSGDGLDGDPVEYDYLLRLWWPE